MLRHAGVRSKLFAVLAIPTVLLMVATAWLVAGRVQSAQQAGQVAALTDVAIQINRVVHSLQQERSVTSEYLQDPTNGKRNAMNGQRRFTNSQLTVLRGKVAASPLDAMASNIGTAAARAAKGHSELLGARKSIDSGELSGTEIDAFYSRIISTDLQLPGVIAASATPALAQRLQAYESLSTTIEYAAHERDLVEIAYLDGHVNEVEFGRASALVAQQAQTLQEFQRSAPPALFLQLDRDLANSAVVPIDKARRHLSDLLKGRDPDYGGSSEWMGAANLRISHMVQAENDLVTDIDEVAASRQSDEQRKATAFVAAAVFGLGLAILLALALAQRITRPLRRLTAAAGDIGDELPRMVERMQTPGDGPGVVVEPIAVETRDEIGRLAEAFNMVNEVTVRVAQEQAALRASIAEMFVNVARRNQVLLGRQLSQLDRLEAREEDPDVLQNLFQLDHLATRMRRNAESLLVLAGIDSTRRLRRPLPLSDVIRTAVGEIEAFDRIDLSIADDPDVSGRHALPIAHLLAELLENATHFSNPGTRVVVATAMTGHGVDVSITDYGLGMSDDEITQANENIAHPPVSEIAVSQRLGLFVVGRIAARLGATAVLRRGRTAGTVVSVGLPLNVFEGLQVEEPVFEEHSIAVPAELAAATIEAASHLFETGDVAADQPVTDAVADVIGDGELVDTNGTAVAAVPAVEHPDTAEVVADDVEAGGAAVPLFDLAALTTDDEPAEEPAAAPSRGRRRSLLPRRSRSEATPLGPVSNETADVSEADDGAGTLVEPVHDAALESVSDGDVTAEPVSDAGDELGLEWPAEVSAEDTDSIAESAAPAEELEHAKRRGSFFRRQRTVAPLPQPVVADDSAPIEKDASAPVAQEEASSDDGAATATPDEVADEFASVDAPHTDEFVATEPDAEIAPSEEAAGEPVTGLAAPARRRRFAGLRRRTDSMQPADEHEAGGGAEHVESLDRTAASDTDETAFTEAETAPASAEAAEPAPAEAVLAESAPTESPVEPVHEEPAVPFHEEPAVPYVFAPAIDILPGRPMRGRATPPAVLRPAATVAVPPPVAPVSRPVQPATEDRVTASESPPAPVVAAVPPLPARAMSAAGAPSGPPLQAAASPMPAPSAAAPANAMSELDQMARSAELHQSALSELRGLYEPSFTPAVAPAPATPADLTRRTPRPAEAITEEVAHEPPARARNASEVRGMLSGFRAGVERGRTAPARVESEDDAPSAEPTS